MGFLSGDSALSLLGKAYLHLRFKKKEVVQRELSIKYEGRYRNAGLMLLFDVLMALAVVASVVIVAGAVYFVAA